MLSPDELACLRCGGGLTLMRAHYACVECGSEYPIVRGIPIFLLPESKGRASIEDSRWERHPVEGLGLPPEWALNHKKEYIRIFRETVLRSHSFHNRVLEIGAGSYWASSLIKQANPDCEVYATDISLNALFKGMQVSQLMGVEIDRVAVCDAHRLPFKDGLFTAVVGVAVIHHMDDPHKAMGEVRRVLRPGGIYVGLREGVAGRIFKPVYRFIAHGVEEEREFGAVEKVFSYDEWKSLLSGFEYIIDLKHDPKLGVAGREKLYYRLANLIPDSILKHLMATIQINARKPG